MGGGERVSRWGKNRENKGRVERRGGVVVEVIGDRFWPATRQVEGGDGGRPGEEEGVLGQEEVGRKVK